MTLPAGSRAPKAIRFTLRTGPIDGTTVATVRLRVLDPKTKTQQTWTMTPSSATTTSVTCVYTLASDGTSVPNKGDYVCAAWLYGAGDVLLDVSKQGSFPIGEPMSVTPPTV